MAIGDVLNVCLHVVCQCFVVQCFDAVYDVGLIHIAASVGLSLLAPRKKINVMLIGNHSAGKSSFVNWYHRIDVILLDLIVT